MNASSPLEARAAKSALTVWVMRSYGIYAMVVGALYFLAGGRWLFSGAGASEINFIGHITEAHAGSLVGLGCIAWGLARARGDIRPLCLALFLANLLGAFVCLLATPPESRGPLATAEIIAQFVWAALFARIGLAASGTEAASAFAGESHLAFGKFLFVSFSVLVVASGLVWLLAPLKFATAAAGSLAGAAAAFAGQTRGAADVSIGIIAWLARSGAGTRAGRAVVIGLLVANLLLVIAGFLAQESVLYTPTRWVVEGLHVFWAIGFAWLLWRISRNPPTGRAAD